MAERDVELNIKVNDGGSLDKVNKELSAAHVSSEELAESTLKATKGLAGGFELAAQAAGVFGKKSEEAFQKTIARATQYVALSNALKDVAEGFSSKNIAGLKGIYDGFVKSAAGATIFGNATRTALSLTGFGLIIVALTTIVAYWDDISKAIGLANDENEKLIDSTQKYYDVVKNNSDKTFDVLSRELEGQLKIANARKDSVQTISDLEVKLAKLKAGYARDEYNNSLSLTQIKIDDLKKQQEETSDVKKQAELEKSINELYSAREKLRLNAKDAENSVTVAIEKQKTDLEDDAKKQRELAEKNKVSKILPYKAEQQTAAETNKMLDDYLAEQQANTKAARDKERDGELISSEEIAEAKKVFEVDGVEVTLKSVADLRKAQADKDEEIRKANQVQEEKDKAAKLKRNQDIVNDIGATAQGIGNVINGITSIIQTNIQGLQFQLDAVNTQYTDSVATVQQLNEQLANADGVRRDEILASIDQEKKKEADLAAQQKKLKNEQIKAQNQINKLNYANNVIQAASTAAQAVLVAISGAPPPFNAVLAAITAAFAVIQTGFVIANKPKDIPTFADGGPTGDGLGFSDHTGHQVAGVVHDGEYVISKKILGTSKGSEMAMALEAMRLNMPTFDVGGFVTTPQLSGNVSDPYNSEIITNAIKQLNLSVAVTEVSVVTQRVSAIESRAGIGT